MRIGLMRKKNRGFNGEMIRANRFARIALRIARATKAANFRTAKRGCFKRGGFPIWTFLSFLSFLGLSRFFRDFPDLLGEGPGIFPIRPFSLFLGLLRAPTRNSPERVCDTIWTFPKKSGKHPGLETPRFSFSQLTCTFGFFFFSRFRDSVGGPGDCSPIARFPPEGNLSCDTPPH